MIDDTFFSLLQDRAHWEFEIFLQLLIDGLILGILWPLAYKHVRHHLDRDRKENQGGVVLQPQFDRYQFRYRPKTVYTSPAVQWLAQLENARRVFAAEFPPGLCYFCKSPTVADGNDIERCEICGAYRIQDEWVSPDAPLEPGSTEGLKQALKVVTKNLDDAQSATGQMPPLPPGAIGWKMYGGPADGGKEIPFVENKPLAIKCGTKTA